MMSQSFDFPIKPSRHAIILNGQPNPSQFLETHLARYRVIIVCDGAWNNLSAIIRQQIQHLPLILLGDGDSIINPPQQFIHIDEQDSTDFEKALNYLMSNYRDKNIMDIDVFQSDGGAMDHALANLALVAKYSLSHSFKFQLISDYYYYRYIHFTADQVIVGQTTAEKTTVGQTKIEQGVLINQAKGKTISILPFPEITIKQTKGFEYAINDQVFTLLTHQSVRNQITENQAKLNYLGSGFLMFSW